MPNARRLPALTLLLGGSVLLMAVSGRGDTPGPSATGPQEVTVLGVVLNPETGVPTVVLQGRRDGRTVAMSIGRAEATGIAFPLAKRTPPRPLTHDLFLTVFGRLDVTVTRVVITDLRDDVYYAVLHLAGRGESLALDSRPSDAIALAIRAGAPVLVEERVFEKSERAPSPMPPAGPRI
jgi:bifunctional DNase/RNase